MVSFSIFYVLWQATIRIERAFTFDEGKWNGEHVIQSVETSIDDVITSLT